MLQSEKNIHSENNIENINFMNLNYIETYLLCLSVVKICEIVTRTFI